MSERTAAGQTTLEAFDEPQARDTAREPADADVDSGDAPGFEKMDDLVASLDALEAVVPGVEPVSATLSGGLGDLEEREKAALLSVRLTALRTHVAEALPDDDPATADRGFQ